MRKIIFVALALATGSAARAQESQPALSPAPSADRADYDRYCVWCHGEKGNGLGPSARAFEPVPRDFTRATFRCRTTPTGSLPTDDDLRAILMRGAPGTAMPSWSALSRRQIDALIATLKGFSPRWQTEHPGARVAVPAPPPATADSVGRGAQIYARMQCASCHGPAGKGDGPASTQLRDDAGNPIRPADFTATGMMKCGDDPERIYVTFMTGLNGTPMPSYDGQLTPAEAWDLVHYIESLRR
jgi:cytochrome c oxidase cbb3-type subunit 2